jgi:hypothetical protein
MSKSGDKDFDPQRLSREPHPVGGGGF